MSKNTRVQQFRNSATDEEWMAAVADHDALTAEEFKTKYGFSWSAILNDAANKGFYQKKRNPSSTLPHFQEPKVVAFTIPAQTEDIEKVSRSVQLSKQTYDRLQRLKNDNRQYTLFAVLNQILDDGLKKYGY